MYLQSYADRDRLGVDISWAFSGKCPVNKLKIGPRNLETSVNHTVLESSLILGCGAGSM